MRFLTVTMLCSSSILALVSIANAQDEAARASVLLDEIVVTAGRTEKKISSAAQSVIVVDRDQIEQQLALGANDAGDLMSRLIPGYLPDTQTISSASETVRGRNVLVMVDGVARNTSLRDQSRILGLIDLNNIERVEVVNGASSLYGAGATGATLNFITKRGESEKPTVTVRTGINGFTENLGESVAPQGNIQVSGKSGRVDYLVSLTGDMTRRQYDGDGREMPSDAMLGQGGGDRTNSGNIFGVVGIENDSGTKRLEASFDWTLAQQKPDYFTNYTTDPVSADPTQPYSGEPMKENSRYFNATYTDSEFALGGLELKAFYNDITKQSPFTKQSLANPIVYYSPTSPFNQSALYAERSGVSATVTTQLDRIREGATVVWGVDYAHDDVSQKLTNDANIISPMQQNSIAAFAQFDIPVTERFRVTAGARYEHFYLNLDDFNRPTAVSGVTPYPAISVLGGEFDYGSPTFNLGGVFDVTTQLQAFGNFSQGYTLTDIGAFTRRAGVNSTAELCDAYGTAYNPLCGNPPDFTISYANIAPKPQLVNSYEVGLRGDFGRFRATATGFYSTSKDGVNYDIAANRVSQQEERIWGAEATFDADVNEMFTVGGLIGYREGRYDADRDGKIESNEYVPNNRIASTVSGMAYVAARFDNGISTRAEVEFFSGRDRTAQKLDGAALVNISVSKVFENENRLDFGIRNVFDTDYINPTASATRAAPVAGLGRTFGLSFTAKF